MAASPLKSSASGGLKNVNEPSRLHTVLTLDVIEGKDLGGPGMSGQSPSRPGYCSDYCSAHIKLHSSNAKLIFQGLTGFPSRSTTWRLEGHV
jgi:hypothetical protein